MNGITVEVERGIPLEQHMMTSRHVGSIEAGLLEEFAAENPTVIYIVVANDTPSTRRPHHHNFVGITENVVFNQNFRRGCSAAVDVVASGKNPCTCMQMRISDFAAEACIDVDSVASPIHRLYVFHPRVGACPEYRRTISPTLKGHALHTAKFYVPAVLA